MSLKKVVAPRPFVWIIEEERLGTWIPFYDDQNEDGVMFPSMMQSEANRTARSMAKTYGIKMRATKYERTI